MRRTKPTILVVEDDENDRIFIKLAFSSIGVTTVQCVENGEAAIAYLSGVGRFADRSSYPYPDFLITDLKMSHGDGFSVLEHMDHSHAPVIVPKVVLTGSQDDDDITKAYLLGASTYLVKPSSPGELRHLIEALYTYWLLCEFPEKDPAGGQLETDDRHKLGHRYTQPLGPAASPSPRV